MKKFCGVYGLELSGDKGGRAKVVCSMWMLICSMYGGEDATASEWTAWNSSLKLWLKTASLLKTIRTSLEEDLVAFKQIVAHFATETRRGFDQAAAETRELRAFVRAANEEMRKRFRETGERLREISREGRERERRLDERIDKLVSAVGEMLRTQNPPRQS